MISVCGSCLLVYQALEDAAHVLPSSDPTAHLLPNKVKDFTAFINLVDFCRWQAHSAHKTLLTGTENEHDCVGCFRAAKEIRKGKLRKWKLADTLIVTMCNWRYSDMSVLLEISSFFPSLCSELLLTKHVEYFQSWMYPLSHELILHSIRNPLVSGFYKLLSVTMKVAKRIKYYRVILLLVETSFSVIPSSNAMRCPYHVE